MVFLALPALPVKMVHPVGKVAPAILPTGFFPAMADRVVMAAPAILTTGYYLAMVALVVPEALAVPGKPVVPAALVA
jgi:hypothetical protein